MSEAPIPVSVLTGFLGSGKTTLLAKLLQHSAFSRTAVIINEFGEVGLDHDLVETSDESFVQLQTGCLCCTVRDDLSATLVDLLTRRARGLVPSFERIVIETSGLADPAPILQALMCDPVLAPRIALSGVVTTVDAVIGTKTLDQQPEATKQAAVADRLVLTKTDLDAHAGAALEQRLQRLNPMAPVVVAAFGEIDPALLFDGGAYDPAARPENVREWLAADDGKQHAHGDHDHGHGHGHDSHASHDPGISCHVLLRDAPLPAVALTLLLETLAEHCGEDLLRLKGIVSIAENPEQPAVVHGVQHVFHPPAWLSHWPSEDRRTRLVLFVRGLPKAWFERLIDALVAEVLEVGQAGQTTSQ